ncbi:MAG: glycoside hydrolase family 88 protein [Nibricoccus sp.]
MSSASRFEARRLIDRATAEENIRFVLAKIDANLPLFTDQFPSPVGKDNVYAPIPNNYWTTSFWTGMVWLAYEVTREEKYLRVAERHLASFRERLEKRVETDTHDLGFLYILSCMAGYKLTRSEQAKTTALAAADLLMTRYFEKAGIIQAWGNLNDPKERGRMIIDCCMNLPLLYWASEMTGAGKYKTAASNHALQSARYLVRPDSSTYHTFYMDTETGSPKFGKTSQGFSDSSCWARGQAWGVYGFSLSYLYTQDTTFVDYAKRLADYFLERLPEDAVSYWDLVFTSGNEERDASAAAIIACGLLELIKHLPPNDRDRVRYENAAHAMIASLSQSYTSKNSPASNAVLLHSVYAKSNGLGVDECCIWGDYFYFEALVRITRDWQPYW